jgi:putative nucleotidyltransferase with HDIG domain
MDHARAKMTRLMLGYFGEDNARIEHALRVLCNAERIMLDRPECDAEIVIASALLHDIGVKVSEEKQEPGGAETQEEYGPPEAEKLLRSIDFPQAKTDKVKDIIGNHHSPSRYDYAELEVLKEADAVVNRGG